MCVMASGERSLEVSNYFPSARHRVAGIFLSCVSDMKIIQTREDAPRNGVMVFACLPVFPVSIVNMFMNFPTTDAGQMPC